MDDILSKRERRYLEIAMQMAHNSSGNHKHGAVVVKSGRILGKGSNSYVTARHAEANACGQNWRSELAGATVFVVRLRRNQLVGLSRPCPECEKMLRECKVHRVIYSTNDVNNPIAIEKY